jgi:hypothetical protein
MRQVGKVKTETLLIIGVAAIGLYLVMRPKTPVASPIVYPPGYNPYSTAATVAAGNSTSSIISAAGGAAAGILNSIAKFSSSDS